VDICEHVSAQGGTMKKPIDMMLDAVEWKPAPEQEPGDLPHVTHEGVLRLGDISLRVYQLSSGQRVISEQDLADLFCFSSVDEFRQQMANLGSAE